MEKPYEFFHEGAKNKQTFVCFRVALMFRWNRRSGLDERLIWLKVIELGTSTINVLLLEFNFPVKFFFLKMFCFPRSKFEVVVYMVYVKIYLLQKKWKLQRISPWIIYSCYKPLNPYRVARSSNTNYQFNIHIL